MERLRANLSGDLQRKATQTMRENSSVQAWEETVTIPTYCVPAPDRNPMFLEKRVYQGSSGKVYPNPFTDRVSNEKGHREYRAVFLENEYLRLMILPEIGGRIHVGLDKTNHYDFVYHQHVIKPALVGLLGPWISGGVEFNWPQHHRPSTFMPVVHWIEEHDDGSRTVWLSEHEPMNRMKGMVGIRLHPGKAIVEAHVRLYNRTPFVQTFLWWANLGVHVHEQYQAFFPPDVTYVADHAKRAVCEFPVAKGCYYGVDYSQGVDIRWYKNIPVPTSYMVTESSYDFFGGYDHSRQAGVVHVADHTISPGKKLWTWGNAEFGYGWDRELTDSDGPYVELMAGVFTDNQPDFSWLHPYETRTFRQYWYPIQQIGPAKNANRSVAVSLEIDDGLARIGVCSTEAFPGAKVILSLRDRILIERTVDLTPGAPLVEKLELPETAESGLLLTVRSQNDRELIRYRTEEIRDKIVPSPASEPPAPQDVPTSEELYLTGLHLDQYRHATRCPESYWREALRRDPLDVRSNNRLGLHYLRQGEFKQAEAHFRWAIRRLTRRNPNPYDGEPYYNLGLSLRFQGRLVESYAAFSKAVWNYAWQAPAYYALAEVDCQRVDYDCALEHLERSLDANAANLKARNLKTAVLRRIGRHEEARRMARQTVASDPLDFWSRHELALLSHVPEDCNDGECMTRELRALMREEAQVYLDIAFDYGGAGLWEDARELLGRLVDRLVEKKGGSACVHPMMLYTLGYAWQESGDTVRARELYCEAAQARPDYCFPARLEEMLVLESAQALNPNDAKAFYYLGNLLYDKKRCEDAIKNWEASRELDPGFSIPWRNLGIAYYNVRHDAGRAADAYRKAFAANPNDARILYEMDQLSKRLGVLPEERLAVIEQHPNLAGCRDDLTIERASLYNQTGRPQAALDLIMSRRFHPWEGGEGLVSSQYVWAHVLLGRQCLESGKAEEALAHFRAAQQYPENLGEGKHLLTPENHLHYFAGLAQERLGDSAGAAASFEKASQDPPGYSSMTFYQALALKKLGQSGAAIRKLQELLAFAAGQIDKEVAIDYFATSLPNFLLFEDDLQKRNRIDCLFLTGLAWLGLEQAGEAEKAFRRVLSLDINHLGAQEELRRISLA